MLRLLQAAHRSRFSLSYLAPPLCGARGRMWCSGKEASRAAGCTQHGRRARRLFQIAARAQRCSNLEDVLLSQGLGRPPGSLDQGIVEIDQHGWDAVLADRLVALGPRESRPAGSHAGVGQINTAETGAFLLS